MKPKWQVAIDKHMERAPSLSIREACFPLALAVEKKMFLKYIIKNENLKKISQRDDIFSFFNRSKRSERRRNVDNFFGEFDFIKKMLVLLNYVFSGHKDIWFASGE